MDGVILFVDDKVHDSFVEDGIHKRAMENELFESLRKDYPVLGVNNLDLAERAIKSIGSFSAIILDWIFEDKMELLDSGESPEELKFVHAGSVKRERTLRFLEDNDFYSLVYIYSNEDVKEMYGDQLTARFGPRIQFEKKTKEGLPVASIIKSIENWKEQHGNLSVPFAWTATINQAIQQIFKELAEADENWVREIGNSAKADGVNEEIFIIEILQYLLAESLTQNPTLIKSIEDYLTSQAMKEIGNNDPQNEKSVAKLFRRLFYTKLDKGASIMTGDICELGEDRFGIIITPECDVKDVLNGNISGFELLTFSKGSFDSFLKTTNSYERNMYAGANADRRTKLGKIFNQNDGKYHVLPSFPFDDESFNLSTLIDFSRAGHRFTIDEIKGKRKYKLNSPFIQQLRQRYISHVGRVGVPSLPSILRNFNLRP